MKTQTEKVNKAVESIILKLVRFSYTLEELNSPMRSLTITFDNEGNSHTRIRYKRIKKQ